MASGLSKGVRRIESAVALLGALGDRLRYLQQPMDGLIEGVCALRQFEELDWLSGCRDRMRRGESFPTAWRGALLGSAGLDQAQAEILLPLGEVLGSTDLDSQLASLAHARTLLENRLGEARTHRQQHARLYRSLGVLCGLAVVVVLL